jgi:hypothetical protein
MKKILSVLFLIFVFLLIENLYAQQILFDFDNAPLHSPLPIYQTAGGITAHLSATGQGHSIQYANALGFPPPGFAGLILYPNSINISDIRIHFDQILNDFSIMYCCQELGCDDAATMKVTAYLNGAYVGFNTKTATFPGTWPVDTLRCTFPQGFDSVIIHYFLPPPTCQDYGVIYLADNMRITPIPVGVKTENEIAEIFSLKQNYPNPFNPSTVISFQLAVSSYTKFTVYDILGNEVSTLVNEQLKAGSYEIECDGSNYASGVYYYQLRAGDFVETKKMLMIK